MSLIEKRPDRRNQFKMSNTWPPLELPFTDLAAGSVAGAAQVFVGQPLDTIRVRAQLAPRGMFNGPWDIFKTTVKKEGVLALYKGQ